MTKVTRLLILIIVAGLCSCDRFGFYKYEVTNTLSIPVEVKFTTSYDSTETITVDPKATLEFYRSRTGALGRNEKPHDIYNSEDLIEDFKSLTISLDNKTIRKDFRIRNEWTYTSINRQFGLYSLTIDSTDVRN